MKHAPRRARSAFRNVRAALIGAVVAIGAITPSTLLVNAGATENDGPPTVAAAVSQTGIEKLEHLVFIVQENRSFDHYFGSFPGADGLTFDENGDPTNCVPDPALGKDRKSVV